MAPILEVFDLIKTYGSGQHALEKVNLTVNSGEIFALLGPNGAGKTTLISMICGLTKISEGRILVKGFDIRKNYRTTRKMIGLVPQELHVDAFESVINTLRFSRRLFGLKRNDAYLEQILSDLSLLDKKNAKVSELSGGMKRRVLIAKALSHEPELLFLDEPTAGVDVALRKDMWGLVRKLRAQGTTIILTTHYIEEAEEMADRIGIINKGRLLLVEEKRELMQRLGKKRLLIELVEPLATLPEALSAFGVVLSNERDQLSYEYETGGERTGIRGVISALSAHGIQIADMSTRQSSLEEIFVDLVEDK